MKNIKNLLVILAAFTGLIFTACRTSSESTVYRTIVFIANGGTGEMKNQRVEDNANSTISECLFSKEGHYFSHWNTKVDDSGTSYENKGKIKITKDAVLYAQWTQIGKTERVSFSQPSGYIKSGTQITLKSSNDAVIYYTTDGSNPVESETVKEYTGAITISGNESADKIESVTIKAYARENNGYLPSDVATANYKISRKVILRYENGLPSGSKGTGAIDSQIIYEGFPEKLSANTLIAPSGMRFAYWTEDKTDSDTVNRFADESNVIYVCGDTAEDTFTGMASLYAVWTDLGSIDLQYRLGTEKDFITMSVETHSTSENVILYTPEKPGYSFDGWYSTDDFEGAALVSWNAGEVEAGKTVIVYAKFTAVKIKINYVMNEGETHNNPDFYTTDKGLTLLPATRKGCNFDGWYKNKKSETEFEDKVDIILPGSLKEYTLYPKFKENLYTVIFNKNAEDAAGSMENGTFSSMNPKALPENAFTRTGYVFAGWNTKADGSGVSYENTQSVIFTEGTELYAQWANTVYKLTFNSNNENATGSMIQMTFKSGEVKKLLSNGFELKDYYFDSWNTTASGNGISYRNNDLITLKKDTVLYAQWTEIGRLEKVRFSVPGGTVLPGTKVGLSSMFADTKIYYSLDPVNLSDPVEYTDLIEIDVNKTISAWATSDYYRTSLVNTIEYKVARPVTVTFKPGLTSGPQGTGSMENQLFYEEITDTVKPCTFKAPSGMHFAYWSVDDDKDVDEKSRIKDGATGHFSFVDEEYSANSIFYAVWVPDGNYICELKNLVDGDFKTAWTQSFSTAEKVTINRVPSAVSGYTFDGWYDDPVTGSKVTGWNAGEKNSNVVLYAHFNPIVYSIEYKLASGETTDSPKTYTKDKGASFLPAKKDGYYFVGWFAQREGSSEENYVYSKPVASIAAGSMGDKGPFYPKFDKKHSESGNIKIAGIEKLYTGFETVIPAGETRSIEINDDLTWDNYLKNPVDSQKGVFLNGRKVKLTAFEVGKYAVTRDLYKAVMKADLSISKTYGSENADYQPADMVSWYKAIAFCNKLSKLMGYDICYRVKGIRDWVGLSITSIPTSDDDNWNNVEFDESANGYRLLTETEWEYVARGADSSAEQWQWAFAGTQSSQKVEKGSTDTDSNFNSYGWYSNYSSNVTHQVGLKEPVKEALKIYDMSGNTYEWVFDASETTAFNMNNDKNYKDSKGYAVNPRGYAVDDVFTDRVVRGGSFSKPASECIVSQREVLGAYNATVQTGFRIARSLNND